MDTKNTGTIYIDATQLPKNGHYRGRDFETVSIISEYPEAVLLVTEEQKLKLPNRIEVLPYTLQLPETIKKDDTIIFPHTNILYVRNPLVYVVMFIHDIRKEYSFIEYAVKRADKFIAVSEAVRQELKKEYNIEAELRLNKSYLRLTDINSRIPCTIPKPFALYPAEGWTHKNHKVLTSLKINVVVTSSIPIQGKNIINMGYVSDEMLVTLYKNCEYVVYPSTIEGFGLPLKEAQLFNKKIYCTDLPALREIGGTYPVYVKKWEVAFCQG